MPRTAVLADIHGNVPAFEAVLADLATRQVDEVLLGGDLVGRGPQGSRVVTIARERGWRSIRGNHEDYLLQFRRGEIPAEWRHDAAWSAARWMAAELSESQVPYLESLPMSLRSETMPTVRLVHGTPTSNCDGIGPWTSDARMVDHLTSIDEEILVCAHTHRPLDRRFSTGRVINVGSVGLPFNRDQRAQYVVLDDDSGELEAEFRRVEYDLDEILAVYDSSGFLTAGGITAQLLVLELKHAAPFLVPFFAWAANEGREPTHRLLPEFLDLYDPDRQREFFAHLRPVEQGSRN
jgi:predicted phosphodiesterase